MLRQPKGQWDINKLKKKGKNNNTTSRGGRQNGMTERDGSFKRERKKSVDWGGREKKRKGHKSCLNFIK